MRECITGMRLGRERYPSSGGLFAGRQRHDVSFLMGGRQTGTGEENSHRQTKNTATNLSPSRGEGIVSFFEGPLVLNRAKEREGDATRDGEERKKDDVSVLHF